MFITLFISCHSTKEELFKQKVWGIVTQKFIQEHNHGFKILTIQQFDGIPCRLQDTYYLGMWEFSEIGDTIQKVANCDTLIVKKTNGEKESFVVTSHGYSLF